MDWNAFKTCNAKLCCLNLFEVLIPLFFFAHHMATHGHTWPHMAIHGQGWAVSIQATQTSSRTTLAKVRSSGAELSITGPLQWPQHWTPEMMKRSNLVQGSCWIGVEECNFTWFCIWYPVGSETQCNLRWHCGHKWKEVPVELEAHLQSKPAASPKKELFACHLGWFSSNILPETRDP